MSKLVQSRIKHGEVWDEFREAVNELYPKQLGSIGAEVEEALILWMRENAPERYKKLYASPTPSNDTPENKDEKFFSDIPTVGNKHYQALYNFLLEIAPGQEVHFNVIKQFVSKRGKSGEATFRKYADTMQKHGIITPIEKNSYGASAYGRYKVLKVLHHGQAIPIQESPKSHNP